jgi:hypothetical protein
MANVVVRFARGIGPNAWDVNGAYQRFLRSPEIRAALEELGQKIHEEAGGDEAGFALEVQAESGRRGTPRVAIIAASYEAREAEAVDRVLTRAVENNRD